MRTTADFLGLVAYLMVMSGGLLDRELLATAYRESIAGQVDGRHTPGLRLVQTGAESTPEDTDGKRSEEARPRQASAA